MIWQPLREDVGPVEARLSEAVRAMILADPEGQADPGWRSLELGGGQALHLHLAARPSRRASHAGRSALVYDLSGQAIIGRDTYVCAGQAVVDLKTRAFLDVTCALRPFGSA